MRDAAPALSRLARRVRVARLALAWERLWLALWPATAVVLGFAALAVWGAFEVVPGWLHFILFVAFGVAVGLAAWRGFRELRWPGHAEAGRRMEELGGAPHRPLQVLSDTLRPPSDVAALALWRAHRRRALAQAARLRVGWPRAGLAARDPRGFRAALALVLLVGVVAAGGDWQRRVAHALTPDPRRGTAPSTLSAWIVPPAYTAAPPIFLTPQQGQSLTEFVPPAAPDAAVQVPEGSTLAAHVQGGRGIPKLRADGDAVRFAAVDSDNYQTSRTLESAGRIAVDQGRRELAAWNIEVVLDAPPSVAFAGPLGVDRRARMHVLYDATDDYGLESLRLDLQRLDADDSLSLDIPLPGGSPRAANATRVFDLTPHPWAGLTVGMTLEAIDARGQAGRSSELRIRLPERDWSNPIARAVIEQRRNLALDPARREEVRERLDALAAAHAEDIGDFGTYLSLRSSIARLAFDASDTAVAEVVDQLWDTAVALEDGAVGITERALRDAQQALQDALSRDAPSQEIERLVEELRDAMEEYLSALAERSQGQPQQPGEQGPPNRAVLAEDLMGMLDRAQELSAMGAREAAQQMLTELQQLMENLRSGQQQQTPQQGLADETLRELDEMMERQQQLIDQTFQQEQRGLFGDPEQLPEADEQQSLRQQLEETMEGVGDMLGGVPEQFGAAAEAMEGAEGALEEGDAAAALGRQTEALNQLRQGAAEVFERMLEGMLGDGGQPDRNSGGEEPRVGVDPLGRPTPGLGADISDRTRIPDGGAMQRAAEILEELIRRSSELGRPTLELEYLERLLRRF